MRRELTELFGIRDIDVEKLISVALSKGGDFADLYFEYTVANELSLRDTQVNTVSSNIDYGVGIRVLKGEKTGYAFSEKTTMKEMLSAAEWAAEIASSNTSKNNINISFSSLNKGNFYPILNSSCNMDNDITDKKNCLIEINDTIFSQDKRVIKVIERYSDSINKILYYNSLGGTFYDIRPLSSINVTCVMEFNGKIENFSVSRSYRKQWDFIDKELIIEIANEVVSGCSKLFISKQPPCGEMMVVMGAGSSGILLHEAIGHTFEADFNRKKVSIFSDKMGKKICNQDISIVDDGTIQYNRGSINIDDEGVESQKTYMVKDGILNSFLHDRISAKYYNTAPTGNGRRESFRFMPIPRMRTTYMENGNSKEADLIKSVEKGIFVDTFSNGQVQIGAGDFSFYVKSGYLIENGKLTKPIKDANIIGNGPTTLEDIIGVADNLKIDDGTWTCGKEQYCPVSCGMPSVLIKKLNVGGINE